MLVKLQAVKAANARAFLPEFGRLLPSERRTIHRLAPPPGVAAENEVEPTGCMLANDQQHTPGSQHGMRGIEGAQSVFELEEVQRHHGEYAIAAGVQIGQGGHLERRKALLKPACFLEAGCIRADEAAVGAVEVERTADLRRELRRAFADLDHAQAAAFGQPVERGTDALPQGRVDLQFERRSDDLMNQGWQGYVRRLRTLRRQMHADLPNGMHDRKKVRIVGDQTIPNILRGGHAPPPKSPEVLRLVPLCASAPRPRSDCRAHPAMDRSRRRTAIARAERPGR